MAVRRMPSPLSAGGALQANIPLIAKMAVNKIGVESRDCFMEDFDVMPPAFGRCRMDGLRSYIFHRASNHGTMVASSVCYLPIMPGIDPPGKQFCIAVNP